MAHQPTIFFTWASMSTWAPVQDVSGDLKASPDAESMRGGPKAAAEQVTITVSSVSLVETGCCALPLEPSSSPFWESLHTVPFSELTEDRHEEVTVCTVVGHSSAVGQLSAFGAVHSGDDSGDSPVIKLHAASFCVWPSGLRTPPSREVVQSACQPEPAGGSIRPAAASVKGDGLAFSLRRCLVRPMGEVVWWQLKKIF